MYQHPGLFIFFFMKSHFLFPPEEAIQKNVSIETLSLGEKRWAEIEYYRSGNPLGISLFNESGLPLWSFGVTTSPQYFFVSYCDGMKLFSGPLGESTDAYEMRFSKAWELNEFRMVSDVEYSNSETVFAAKISDRLEPVKITPVRGKGLSYNNGLAIINVYDQQGRLTERQVVDGTATNLNPAKQAGRGQPPCLQHHTFTYDGEGIVRYDLKLSGSPTPITVFDRTRGLTRKITPLPQLRTATKPKPAPST